MNFGPTERPHRRLVMPCKEARRVGMAPKTAQRTFGRYVCHPVVRGCTVREFVFTMSQLAPVRMGNISETPFGHNTVGRGGESASRSCENGRRSPSIGFLLGANTETAFKGRIHCHSSTRGCAVFATLGTSLRMQVFTNTCGRRLSLCREPHSSLYL